MPNMLSKLRETLETRVSHAQTSETTPSSAMSSNLSMNVVRKVRRIIQGKRS